MGNILFLSILGTISESDGTYTIEGLPSGKYVVKAVTSGYAMQCREAEVVMPQTTPNIDLSLEAYPYSVATVAEHIISPQGGNISVANETSGFNFVGIEIPSGSLSEYSLMSVSELPAEVVPMPQVLTGINIPIHLGPEGSLFNEPATLQVEYTDQDLDAAGAFDASELDVFTLNTDTFKWEKVEGNKIVDYVHKRIEIELSHFFIYQLARSTAAKGDFTMDQDVDGQDIAAYIRQTADGGSPWRIWPITLARQDYSP